MKKEKEASKKILVDVFVTYDREYRKNENSVRKILGQDLIQKAHWDSGMFRYRFIVGKKAFINFIVRCRVARRRARSFSHEHIFLGEFYLPPEAGESAASMYLSSLKIKHTFHMQRRRI